MGKKPGGMVGVLLWLWAGLLSLVFTVVGLALAGCGVSIAVLGIQGMAHRANGLGEAASLPNQAGEERDR